MQSNADRKKKMQAISYLRNQLENIQNAQRVNLGRGKMLPSCQI